MVIGLTNGYRLLSIFLVKRFKNKVCGGGD